MTPRQQRSAWAALVVLGVLLPFAPAVLGLRTLSQRDTDQLYGPVRTLVVEALRDGRLPLWNPYEGTGKPLFAEGIHSVLHPLSLLGAAVAPSSIDFLILAYLVAAALGAFLLARSLDASEPAAAGAGLSYALSGYSVSMTGNLVFLAGLSTLPWLLAAARSAGRGSRWGVVLTALATASAFFSGDVQVAIVGLALGLLLAADAGGPRGAARALAGFAPGILLAAVQILASWELLPQALRGEGLEDWEKTAWALRLARLLEWAIPGLARGALEQAPVGSSGASLEPVFAESVYLGAPLLFTSALGAAALPTSARRRTGLLLAGAAAVLLWLALGHQLGARQLLDWVPVWSRFRYSEKLMAPLALCLAALAARGIDASSERRPSRPWGAAIATLAILFAAGFFTLHLAPSATTAAATRLLGDSGPFHRANLAAGLPHAIAALVALLLVHRIPQPLRTPALALLVALAPAAAVYQGAHLGAHAVRRLEAPLARQGSTPAPRLAQPGEGQFRAPEGEDFVEATARQWNLLGYPAANVASRIDTIQSSGAFKPTRLWSLAASFEGSWTRSFRRYGLTHVALPEPHDFLDPELVEHSTAGGALLLSDASLGVELWTVPHRPWAFFAERSVAVRTADDALRVLLHLVARGDDGEVVLEAPERAPTSPGRVLSVDRGTERVRVEAESPGPGLLVVQEAFWPGWRASIDGRPAAILAADYLVRAVRWPAGHHTLEMVYEPPALRTGLALSAAGALLLLAIGALALLRARKATA